MATKKIFTPEDFKKNGKPKKKGYNIKKIITGIAAFAVVCAIIIGIISLITYTAGSNKTAEDPDGITKPQDGTPYDSIDSIQTDTIPMDVEDKGKVESQETTEPLDGIDSEKESDPIPPQTIPNPIQTNNIESEALRVIRGDYGNNPVRQNRLGANYQTIQDRVNQLKRDGFF